jgi:hypothetical protein
MLALYVLFAFLGSVVAQVRLLTSPPIPDNNGQWLVSSNPLKSISDN